MNNTNGKFVEISKFFQCFWDSNKKNTYHPRFFYLWDGEDRGNHYKKKFGQKECRWKEDPETSSMNH